MNRTIAGTELVFESYDELKECDLITLHDKVVKRESEDVFVSIKGNVIGYKLQWNKSIFIRTELKPIHKICLSVLLTGKHIKDVECIFFEK